MEKSQKIRSSDGVYGRGVYFTARAPQSNTETIFRNNFPDGKRGAGHKRATNINAYLWIDRYVAESIGGHEVQEAENEGRNEFLIPIREGDLDLSTLPRDKWGTGIRSKPGFEKDFEFDDNSDENPDEESMDQEEDCGASNSKSSRVSGRILAIVRNSLTRDRKCNAMVQRGPRKGQPCGKKAQANGFCGHHSRHADVEARDIQAPSTSRGNAGTCQATITSGPRKGQPCGKKAQANGFCGHHSRHADVEARDIQASSTSRNAGTCQATIKSGSRKGQPCTFKAKANGFCGRHGG